MLSCLHVPPLLKEMTDLIRPSATKKYVKVSSQSNKVQTVSEYIQRLDGNADRLQTTIVQFVGEVDSSQGSDVGEVALPLPVKQVALQ